MNWVFLPEARDEFWEAALYYESNESGLGTRFRNEVAKVIHHIVADPTFGESVPADIGASIALSFRYYVAYFIRSDQIVIAATAHGHRKPDYWKHRAKNI